MLQIVRNNFEVFVSRTRASRRQLVRPTCIYAARDLSRCTDLRDAPFLSSLSSLLSLWRLCVGISMTTRVFLGPWSKEIRRSKIVQRTKRKENGGKKFFPPFSSTVRLNFFCRREQLWISKVELASLGVAEISCRSSRM